MSTRFYQTYSNGKLPHLEVLDNCLRFFMKANYNFLFIKHKISKLLNYLITYNTWMIYFPTLEILPQYYLLHSNSSIVIVQFVSAIFLEILHKYSKTIESVFIYFLINKYSVESHCPLFRLFKTFSN